MSKNTQTMVYHVGLPTILTVLFFVNAALPKTTLGCANRGIVALTIAFISVVAGLFTAIMALRKSASARSESGRWIISTLILLIPVIGLLLLA